MSGLGQKATCTPQKVKPALPPKADMCGATSDVRYGPKNGHRPAIRSPHRRDQALRAALPSQVP